MKKLKVAFRKNANDLKKRKRNARKTFRFLTVKGVEKMKHITKVYWFSLIAYGISLFFDDGVRTGTNILLIGIFYYLFTITKHLNEKK